MRLLQSLVGTRGPGFAAFAVEKTVIAGGADDVIVDAVHVFR
jgi:hypothetical protein